jgi:hypothetical protein
MLEETGCVDLVTVYESADMAIVAIFYRLIKYFQGKYSSDSRIFVDIG